MLREWAYARTYQTPDERSEQFDPWRNDYNFHRPHASLTLKTPASRAGLNKNSLLSLHSVSMKDRAAILTSGHAAKGAFWVDHEMGTWGISAYWMKQVPAWASSSPRVWWRGQVTTALM